MDLLLYIIFFLPAVLAFMYSGWNYAQMSVRFREVSIFSPAGVPVFPLKALIPVTGVLLLLQGIAEIIRCVLCIRTAHWPQRLHDVEETESIILQEQQHSRAEAGEPAAAGSEGGLSMTDPQVGMLMLGLFIFIIMLGFPDRLHADGDGRRLRLLRLLHARPGVLRQPHLHAAGAEDVRGHVERRADGGAAVPVHGLRGRARQHPRSPVPFAAALDEERARRARGGDAGHLRDVRDRDRHRRRGGDADGPAGLPGHAARRLRRQALGRRGVRGRLSRHPDPAQHPADRLCRDRRRLGGQALCRGVPARASC